MEVNCIMTAIRQEAIQLLEKMPEDRLRYIVQIMRGINRLYNDNQSEKKEAVVKLEQLRKKEQLLIMIWN